MTESVKRKGARQSAPRDTIERRLLRVLLAEVRELRKAVEVLKREAVRR